MLLSLLEVGVLPMLWHQAQLDGSGRVVALNIRFLITTDRKLDCGWGITTLARLFLPNNWITDLKQ